MSKVLIKRKKRKINVAPKTVAKKTVEAKPHKKVHAAPRVETKRFTHDIKSAYGGASPTLNSRKSKTPLRVEQFGTAPDLVLSDRDNSILNPLKNEYGRSKFMRGNLDAGIANRAIRKGILRLVSGQANDEAAMLQFVK